MPGMALQDVRVLVVDDNAKVRFILATELKDAGAMVVAIEHDDAALCFLSGDAQIDVMVIDVSMPGMDGWTLARRARALRPRLLVLYVTRWFEAEPQPGHGARIVLKPFSGGVVPMTVAALVTKGSSEI